MANKVLFGVSNCYVAKITESGDTITYGTPFAVKGVVGISFEPEGEESPFYADNIKYYIASSNQGYTGELELAVTPNEFLTEILGNTTDSNGAILETAGATTSRFALMFEGEGDSTGRRWVFYDCTAQRPSRENNTIEDEVEVGTETLEITMSPRKTDKAIRLFMEKTDDNATAYNNFFNAVYERTASV